MRITRINKRPLGTDTTRFMMIYYAVLTFFTTIAGGLLALKTRGHHYVLFGLSAGVILAVAFFDIIPEIVSISQTLHIEIKDAFIYILVGILLFHIFEKYILIHHTDESHEHHGHKHVFLGIGGALALIGHSFLDGIGIGLAFQVSHQIGLAVAIAVLAHDFADGINTVSLMMSNKNNKRRTILFLIADALAPVLGALSTLLFIMNYHFMIVYLGIFAGFLIYIALSHVLPEAHADKPSWKVVVATLLGTTMMYFILEMIA